jgi:hypothetical protein
VTSVLFVSNISVVFGIRLLSGKWNQALEWKITSPSHRHFLTCDPQRVHAWYTRGTLQQALAARILVQILVGIRGSEPGELETIPVFSKFLGVQIDFIHLLDSLCGVRIDCWRKQAIEIALFDKWLISYNVKLMFFPHQK